MTNCAIASQLTSVLMRLRDNASAEIPGFLDTVAGLGALNGTHLSFSNVLLKCAKD
jgi:hypothetical protein